GLREPVRDANAAFGAAFAKITAARDWRERAWILADRDGDIPGGVGEVDGFVETTNTLAFRARVTTGPGYVVVSEVQAGGWTARGGGGGPVEVRRANGPFRAVALPEGEHAVTLTYRPPGFRIGTAVSLLAAVAAVGLTVASRAASRRFSSS